MCACVCVSDTGRVVGTGMITVQAPPTPAPQACTLAIDAVVVAGTCGPLAAQEAMARAQKQLAVEANILINICNFQVCDGTGNATIIRSLYTLSFRPERRSSIKSVPCLYEQRLIARHLPRLIRTNLTLTAHHLLG